jgi:hypothetical protein
LFALLVEVVSKAPGRDPGVFFFGGRSRTVFMRGLHDLANAALTRGRGCPAPPALPLGGLPGLDILLSSLGILIRGSEHCVEHRRALGHEAADEPSDLIVRFARNASGNEDIDLMLWPGDGPCACVDRRSE